LPSAESPWLGNFQRERVRLVEHDAGGNQVLDTARVQCDDDSGESVLSDGDAIYEINWLVTVN
jgi:hypothetical protein